MAGEAADRNWLSEKDQNSKNKRITWLNTAQDGALRKTVHFGSGRKVL